MDKKKTGQASKAVRFVNERKKIVNDIIKTIGITKENNTMIVKNMRTTIQQTILDMEDDIRKYFNAGGWHVFKKGIEVERPFLSIIKKVMNEMGIELVHFHKNIQGEMMSCYLFNFTDNTYFDD